MRFIKRTEKKSKENTVSFRLNDDSLMRLKILSQAFKQTQTEFFEYILQQAYQDAKKQFPQEVRKAERAFKR